MVPPRARWWRFGLGAILCLVLGWVAFIRGSRVPVLGLVDLGFHELGHLVTYVLPDVLTALMGSVAQVAVPLGLAAYFAVHHRDPLGTGLCLAWAGTSARDVSVYVADAPFQALDLIGDTHDWAFVLGRWGLIDQAGAVAAVVRTFGALLLLTGLALCLAGLHRALSGAGRPAAVPSSIQARGVTAGKAFAVPVAAAVVPPTSRSTVPSS